MTLQSCAIPFAVSAFAFGVTQALITTLAPSAASARANGETDPGRAAGDECVLPPPEPGLFSLGMCSSSVVARGAGALRMIGTVVRIRPYPALQRKGGAVSSAPGAQFVERGDEGAADDQRAGGPQVQARLARSRPGSVSGSRPPGRNRQRRPEVGMSPCLQPISQA